VEALELCDRGCVLEPGRVVLAALATRSWPPRAFSAPTWVPTVDTRLVALTRTRWPSVTIVLSTIRHT